MIEKLDANIINLMKKLKRQNDILQIDLTSYHIISNEQLHCLESSLETMHEITYRLQMLKNIKDHIEYMDTEES